MARGLSRPGRAVRGPHATAAQQMHGRSVPLAPAPTTAITRSCPRSVWRGKRRRSPMLAARARHHAPLPTSGMPYAGRPPTPPPATRTTSLQPPRRSRLAANAARAPAAHATAIVPAGAATSRFLPLPSRPSEVDRAADVAGVPLVGLAHVDERDAVPRSRAARVSSSQERSLTGSSPHSSATPMIRHSPPRAARQSSPRRAPRHRRRSRSAHAGAAPTRRARRAPGQSTGRLTAPAMRPSSNARGSRAIEHSHLSVEHTPQSRGIEARRLQRRRCARDGWPARSAPRSAVAPEGLPVRRRTNSGSASGAVDCCAARSRSSSTS